jgi:predicted O-linked N-acetylglucosamine transferase (SPINDLY family)
VTDAGARAFKRARIKKEQQKAIDELLTAAVASYSGGRFAEAQFICNQVLTFQPQNFDALSLLGISQIDSGDKETAEATLKQALALEPRSAEAHCNYGVALFELKRFDEARAAYEKAVKLKPRYATALNNLGNAWKHLGNAEKALEFYGKAIEIDRSYADAWANSGSAHMMRSRYPDAERCLSEALRLNPQSVEALCNMGRLDMLRRNYTAARLHIEMALALRPDFPDGLIQRGWLQLSFGKYEAAYQTCEAAIALAPAAPLVLFAGAETARMAGHSARAAELAQKILDKTPQDQAALSLIGSCMAAWGDAYGALSKYDEAIAIAPNFEAAIANKIFVLDFLPDADFAMHQDARRWWWDHVGQYLPRCALPPVDLDPDRRIRIGYVSSDFRSHSVAFSVLPVLRAHDHAKFAIVAYHCSLENDNVTEEVRAAVDEWVDVSELSDDELAQRIIADRIDILVDLAGYTAGNRISVFARKPAPIQASAWGHPTGTGIPLIDYVLADPVTIPEAVRPVHAEKVADLPCVITVAPIDYPVAPPPMLTKGYVTFGVFNRVEKIADEAIALWGRIFAALPDARLLVKHSMVDDANVRNSLLERLVARGIAAERVIWRGRTTRQEHLLALADVDISLDTFPQNGGVSTWESLYMGVPVVTKLGKTVSGRVAGSILTSIGLAQFAAATEDDYVDIAIRWARTPDQLAVLRQEMHGRIADSESGDTVRYTRRVEALYRRFWQDYCAASLTKQTGAPSGAS